MYQWLKDFKSHTNDDLKILAIRELYFTEKDDSKRKRLVVKLYAPVLVSKNCVSDEMFFIKDQFACYVEFSDIIEGHVFYGCDEFQALAFSSDIDRILKPLELYYDLYCDKTGSRYFM